MIPYIVKAIRWILGLCNHDWKQVETIKGNLTQTDYRLGIEVPTGYYIDTFYRCQKCGKYKVTSVRS